MKASKWLADRQFNFLIGVNVLVVIVATWMSHGQFLDIDNLQSMGGQLPELGLLALGIMLSMVSGNGGIDLSGVGLANLSGMVAAMMLPHMVSADDSPALYTA
ncbi:ABC transporter permease, partial [Caballeronia sp. LP003]|nr:ABC transporter permease [Caballeronia sp. LP003]